MIVDGLRRCSDSPENQRVRPGRQLITFLIASNLAMYVWDTFELKSYELQVSWEYIMTFCRLIRGDTKKVFFWALRMPLLLRGVYRHEIKGEG